MPEGERLQLDSLPSFRKNGFDIWGSSFGILGSYSVLILGIVKLYDDYVWGLLL